VQISGSLQVLGSITGSLFGTASFATTASFAISSSYAIDAVYAINAISASYIDGANVIGTVTSASHADQANNAATADFASIAGNGGVTNIVAGSGITLIPTSGVGAVTIITSGGGGTTIISGSNLTQSFNNSTTWNFNHNLGTRTPIITVFDNNYKQIIPQDIELVNTGSAIITFPIAESGFAIASLGGATGTVVSSSYSLFSTYATTASYYDETDPVFVAKSASLATTGSNTFKGSQLISGSLFVTSSTATLGQFVGNQNGYVEFSLRNTSTGVSASGDIAVYANDGTISNKYIDMGINNSGMDSTYSYFGTDFGNAHDAYVYNVGGNLRIGNATSTAPFSQSFFLFSNPTATPNITMTGSRVGINKSSNLNATLDIIGSTIITGSLTVSGSSTFTNIGPAVFSGSVSISGSTTIVGTTNFSNTATTITGSLLVSGSTTQVGNNTLTGNTVLSGSINISGSSTIRGTTIMTGSLLISGSTTQIGNNTLFGNNTLTGSNAISGSNTIIGGNLIIGGAIITGSLNISGSTTQRGNNTLVGTTTLTGSILINGNIIPEISSSFDLGSETNPWRSIYLQSGSISIRSDIPGGPDAIISNTNGNVSIAAAGFQIQSGSVVPFDIESTGRTIIRIPNIQANDVGGFSIIGNTSGSFQPVTSPGGMVHITGNDGQVNRFNLDAFGSGSTTSFNGVISRAARGTVAAPSQSKAGDVTLRISSIGWRGDTGFGGTSVPGGTATSLDFIVLEDQMNNARGSAQQFYNAPIGTLNRVLSAQIDATGIQTSGSIRAASFTGSFSGSLVGTVVNAQTASYINPLNQNVIITGSLLVSGSTTHTGSLLITGSTTHVGNVTITGSLRVSGSLTEIGDTVLTGSLSLSSGSRLNINDGLYVNGNKQFNYGQFSSTQTQSGSANTAYSTTFNTTDFSQGVSLVSQSRITVANTGLYNIQFSSQLHTTANQAVDFSIWFAMTGSNIANSNTEFTIEKINGGGFQVAALNFLTQISSGSYVELKYSKTTTQGQLYAIGTQSTPTRPATPSVILTVTQIA